MPETTQTELIQIQVESTQAQSALDRLLEAIGKVEQAVIGMGEKFDTAMGQIVEPINNLTLAVDRLDASIKGMKPLDFRQDAMSVQQLKAEFIELGRIMDQHRAKGMKGEVYRPPGSTGVMSREQMIEYTMAGGLGPNVWSGLAEPGPKYVGTPVAPYRRFVGGEVTEKEWGELKGRLPPEMLMQAEEQLAGVEVGFDKLGASVDRVTATITRQDAVIQQASTTLESTGGLLGWLSRAEEQLAASVDRTTVAMRMRAAQQGQGAQGMTAPATWYGPEARPGITTRGPTEQVWGGQRWEEAESLQAVQEAMGKKIVMQALMAQGAENVTNKLKRQFDMTRSKEEILREIGRTGKMTTEMEKELGLQTERTGKQAFLAGGMFRYFGRYLLRYLILWQGIQAVRGIARGWFAAHMEMADAVADFGWRVNATAEDVDRYRDKLRDVSMMAGVPVGQIASPFAGEMAEGDLLRATEAFKVFGGSVEDWARKIDSGTASLDAYAHGLRISTLATEDYAKLVDNASGIAKEFNMSEEETIGLLSVLPSIMQAGGEEASTFADALTGLYEQNQLLMTLGVAPAVTVGLGGVPQRRPMAEMLAEIGRQPIAQQRQLAVAIGLTDQKYQDYFLRVVAGQAAMDEAIKGTVNAFGDMEDAVAGADKSMKAHVESMKAAWTGLLESIGATDAAVSAVEGLTNVFRGMSAAIEDVSIVFTTLMAYMAAATPGEVLALLAMGPMAPMAVWAGVGEVSMAEKRAGAGGAAEPGRGYAGITPGTEGGGEPGPAAWQGFQVMRLPAGMDLGRLQQEVNRLTEDFAKPIQDSMGNWVQLTDAEIKSNTKLIMALDEHGTIIGTLTAYTPALQQATENLKTEIQKFNLERLRDIKPEQFDMAMQTILPMWEARLGAIPGFEEERELHTFFVGEQDIMRQQLATQTAMAYTLEDIRELEKDQLEGMWNIPSGVTMRVPLTSLDLMRWMKSAGGGGVATDMMPAGGALESAATAQDNAAIAMQASAGAQTASAASMSQLSLSLGRKLTGAEVEAGVAREALAAEGIEPVPFTPGAGGHGRRGRPEGRPFREIPTTPTAIPAVGGPLAANFAISLVSTLLLDKKVVAEVVQTELARQLVNTTRTTGGMGGLRP